MIAISCIYPMADRLRAELPALNIRRRVPFKRSGNVRLDITDPTLQYHGCTIHSDNAQFVQQQMNNRAHAGSACNAIHCT